MFIIDKEKLKNDSSFKYTKEMQKLNEMYDSAYGKYTTPLSPPKSHN